MTPDSGAGLGHGATAELLRDVFPHSHVGDARYLEWLYEESPFGKVVEANHHDALGIAAHYAVVPLRFVEPDGHRSLGALSLNTAVRERARRQGLFTRLAEEAYAKARAAGVGAVIGVSNANSTHGMVDSLGFSLLGPLPVRMLPRLPAPGGTVRSLRVTPELLDSGELASLGHLLAPPPGGLARDWTVSSLSWRLAAPGGRYSLHVCDEAFAVSSPAVRRGLRFAVVCAVFAPSRLSARTLRRLFARACRHERAVAATYLGINRNLPGLGLPVPGPLRESPLNLIYRDLADSDRPAPPIARWESLDFDAF